MKNIKKILVVCTGNACRSPMAEGFLRKELSHDEGFMVKSAGISAVDGMKPTPYAVDVMKDESIDISGYLSSCFSKEFAKAADIILVMTKTHKDIITDIMPDLKSKVYLYNEFAELDNSVDIEDPIGKPLLIYKDVCNKIKKASQQIVKKLKSSSKL